MIDFNIIVNATSAGVSKAGFGRIAVLSTELEHDYTIITDLKDVEIDKDTDTYKILRTLFSQKPQPKEVILIGDEMASSMEVLDDLLEETDDFFFIVSNEPSLALAEEVEVLEKMLFATINDIGELESIGEKGLENTVCVYHEEEDQFVGEALAVEMSYDVGGKSAQFKQLKGVKASQAPKEDIEKVLKANGNVYVTKKGHDQISGGRTSSGQWIDVTLGAYWIKFTVDERIMYLALNEKKIPYNNRGVGMLAGAVGTVLAGEVEREILEDYAIEYKDTREISAQEKAARVYDYLTATGQLTGAVHGGDITINLVYEEVGE